MNIIAVKQGDTLAIMSDNSGNAVMVSYDELLLAVKKPKAKKVKTPGVRFSRHVNLVFSAIERGSWSTGAPFEQNVAIDKLIQAFADLADDEMGDVTDNARACLHSLISGPYELSKNQLESLRYMIGELEESLSA